MDIETSNKIFGAIKLVGHHVGVLSYLLEDKSPASAVVYFHTDNSLNVYFATRSDSKKYECVKNNPKVSFVIYSENPAKSVEINGSATEITNPEEKKYILLMLTENAKMSNLILPINQIAEVAGPSEISIIKVSPNRVKLADFDIYREFKTFYEVDIELKKDF